MIVNMGYPVLVINTAQPIKLTTVFSLIKYCFNAGLKFKIPIQIKLILWRIPLYNIESR